MSTKGREPAASDTGFTFVEHTADIGVTAWGPTPAAAFIATARGMYAITLGKDPAAAMGPTLERCITVHGDTWPDLLVNWLAELLFQFSVEGVVAHEYKLLVCAPPRCSATITGIAIEDEDQVEGGEIKAVTYHDLKFDIQPDRTTAQVVLDI